MPEEKPPPYKFIDCQGRETSVPDARAFFDAVDDGNMQEGTLVFDPSESRWRPARELPEFQVALAALGRPELKTGVSRPSPRDRTADGQALEGGEGHSVKSGPSGLGNAAGTPSRPKHRWQGVLYYWLNYIGAGLLALGALAVPVVVIEAGESGALAVLTLVVLAALAVFSFFLARGVQRFQPWSRIVAIILAYGAVVTGTVTMFGGEGGGERLGGMLSVILFLIFLVYFHEAKGMFAGETSASQYAGGEPSAEAVGPAQLNSATPVGATSTSQAGTVRFTCPQCRMVVDAPQEYGEAKCPDCGKTSLVRGVSY
jgi:predicted RNA-binding Zn-ribbon protein involved in translation (DUF1610 family)